MKTILITGGTGFIGNHLCRKLLQNINNRIICLDNNYTGFLENINDLLENNRFTYINADVIDFRDIRNFGNPRKPENFETLVIDEIYHLACPASPKSYQMDKIYTIKTSILGIINVLEFACKGKTKVLFTSTSEIYGEPLVDIQNEEYWGNVNPIGERSCYDESKRLCETLVMEYNIERNVDTRIARIFNTYGPKMNKNDGRVISNFINQALSNENITIYGDGSQTRSFCYIDDTVTGLISLMELNDYHLPVNIGNQNEITIIELCKLILSLSNSKSQLINMSLPKDDPTHRKPDITRAKKLLNWNPLVNLTDGLNKCIEYYKDIRNSGNSEGLRGNSKETQSNF